MCKFCTCDTSLEFFFSVDVSDVSLDDRSVAIKQYGHLLSIQPHCLIFQFDVKICLPIRGLVEDYSASPHLFNYNVLFHIDPFCVQVAILPVKNTSR